MKEGQGAEGAVLRPLEEQVSAWNRGNLEAYMAGYRDSPEPLRLLVACRS